MKKLLLILAVGAASCTKSYTLITNCDGVVKMEVSPDDRMSYELNFKREARQAAATCDVILLHGQDTIYSVTH